jgi:hypothetical protein
MSNVYAFNDIEAGNTVTAFQFIATSSSSLKENIIPLNAGEASGFLARLTPVRYNLKAKPDRRLIGFVAEDVPPELSVDAKGVDIMAVVATLAGALKTQQEALDRATARIDQLERGGPTP